MKLVEHESELREINIRLQSRKLKGGDQIGNQSVDERIILKLTRCRMVMELQVL
jgi:hypothetical protein